MTGQANTSGRIAFVGSGPGDPALLTVRARDVLAGSPLVITDPDVPEGILALAADGAEVRPAVGQPADIASDLLAEAGQGRSVARLVSGDPLTNDAVVAEERAFDPALAAEAGVPEGPKFGALANGSSVTVDGKAINPEEVRTDRTDRFPV